MSGTELFILLGLSVFLSPVPILIAFMRKASNRWAVVGVALLLGWTIIGWIVAIVMAALGKKEAPALA